MQTKQMYFKIVHSVLLIFETNSVGNKVLLHSVLLQFSAVLMMHVIACLFFFLLHCFLYSLLQFFYGCSKTGVLGGCLGTAAFSVAAQGLLN